jgi:hypothetical protein
MFKITRNVFISIHLLGLLFNSGAIASNNVSNLKIKLAEPTFILPAFSGPYSEREATHRP